MEVKRLMKLPQKRTVLSSRSLKVRNNLLESQMVFPELTDDFYLPRFGVEASEATNNAMGAVGYALQVSCSRMQLFSIFAIEGASV